jgi:hypothetical protein
MNKISLLASALLASLSFMACSDDVVMSAYEESKTTASADFTVTDVDGEALDSVTVEWVYNGKLKTSMTDSAGRLVLRDLRAASYRFRFLKDEFAAIDLNVNMLPQGTSDMPIIPDVDATIRMHALGVSLAGEVKLTDSDGNRSLQEGVTLDLEMDPPTTGTWVKQTYTTTTDENGAFVFEDLPEKAFWYKVSVRRFEDDANKVYRATADWTENSTLRGSDVATKLTPFILVLDVPALEIDQTNSEGINSSDDFEMTFSQSVNTGDIMLNDLVVISNSSGRVVAVDFEWANSATELTVTPVNGDWGEAGDYNISGRIESVDGSVLNIDEDFEVLATGDAGAVSGLEVEWWRDDSWTTHDNDSLDSNAEDVALIWNKVSGAVGYEVYRKASDEDNYTRIARWEDADDTTYTADVAGMLEEGSVRFAVVSFTADNRSDLTDATILLEDIVTPKMTSISPLTEYSFAFYGDNSADSDPYVLDTETVNFSEKMDTTASLSITVPSALDPLEVTWEWTSLTAGTFTLQVPANTDASAVTAGGDVSADLSVSGLVDLNGNSGTSYDVAVEVTD